MYNALIVKQCCHSLISHSKDTETIMKGSQNCALVTEISLLFPSRTADLVTGVRTSHGGLEKPSWLGPGSSSVWGGAGLSVVTWTHRVLTRRQHEQSLVPAGTELI